MALAVMAMMGILGFFDLKIAFSYGYRGLIAVQNRHLTVHEDKIIILLGQAFDSLSTVIGNIGAIPQLFKHPFGHPLIDGMILNQENSEN